MDILINVENQKLKPNVNIDTLVEGSENFVNFMFNLGEDWNGLTKFVQFKQKQSGVERAYNVNLSPTNGAYLPSEIIAGECSLVLCGMGENKTAITNALNIKIEPYPIMTGENVTQL